VAGHWINTREEMGLDGFECGACVQIVGKKYSDLNAQRVQELFFTDGLKLDIGIDWKQPQWVNQHGDLVGSKTASDTFVAELIPTAAIDLRRYRAQGAQNLCLTVQSDASLAGVSCGLESDATTCRTSDVGSYVGAGWVLVRRSLNGAFKRAAGLTRIHSKYHAHVHGPASNDPLGPEFARGYDATDFDQFLFATGDCQKWMIMEKTEVLDNYGYANQSRRILKSHTSSVPYSARMYRGSDAYNDPLFGFGNQDPNPAFETVYIHGDPFPVAVKPRPGATTLYSEEMSNGAAFQVPSALSHHGLNVFIRTGRYGLHSSKSKAETDATTCNSNDVGHGWILVRRTESGRFSANDDLAGTAEYGTPHQNPQGSAFSRRFDTMSFDEFLFATGTCQKWMIMKKSQVQGRYTNAKRGILKSHVQGQPYAARMYNRGAIVPADPLLSFEDHNSNWDTVLYA
ncbi:unnamed protein product, partial [Symbiodinium necroappetens]